MNLKEYIEWTKTIDDYKDGEKLANINAWGFEKLEKVDVPKIKIENFEKGSEGYSSIRYSILTDWAKATWPDLKFIDAKIQVQKPGEVCNPHLDFLGYYLEDVCMAHPGLLKLKHSFESPAIDVWRMFIAVEDQIPGHIFLINNVKWRWKKGDCMRLNNWQALHSTKNTSNKMRTIIKVTGVKF